ncbi:hypothetical protein [Microbacterium sp. NPDC076895]|uniref:hypothetical protein n=1 Tax=unclassified Microbacterium TaxID=2609290 RepID=UPI0034214700
MILRAAAETRGLHVLGESVGPPGVGVLIVPVAIDAAGQIVSPRAMRPVVALRAVAETARRARATGGHRVPTTVAGHAARIVTVRANAPRAPVGLLSAGVPIVLGVRIVRPVSKTIGSAGRRSPRRSRREILRRRHATS